jgi:RND family efflux transporter MFP subunit
MKRYKMLFVLALMASIASCAGEEPGEVEKLVEAGTVEVSVVAVAETGSQVPARVVARETANLATRGSGTVESVVVDVGSVVRRGQVLVRLEGSGVESAVARAEAQALVARRTYERLSNLERDGAATKQELDQAEAALRTAEAMLEEATASRDYFVLRAPFDGTVSARYADPGDLAVPGRPVLVITGSRGVKVEADLPAAMADAVSEGDRVSVLSPDAGARWDATVHRVVPVIDLASQRFRVEATFDDADAAPTAGTFVRLEVPFAAESSVWVPSDAVIRRGQLTGVFVVTASELRLRWIRVGRSSDRAVEVLAGLPAGSSVVRSPAPGLLDGASVEGTDTVAWTFSPEDAR